MIDTSLLTEVLKSLTPAVISREFTSAAGCFCFRDGLVLSYNGIIGMWRKFDVNFEGLVAAKPLLGFLNASRSKEVDFDRTERSELRMKAGRSKLTLALLSTNTSAFRPEAEVVKSIFQKVEDVNSFIEALKKASISLGEDTKRPERLGVSCGIRTNQTTLYSTDNTSMTEVICDIKSAVDPKDEVALRIPAPFCTLLQSVHSKDNCTGLHLSDSGLLASFQSGLWAFTLLPLEPDLDKFSNMFDKYLSTISGEFTIPIGLSASLQRAECLMDNNSFDACTRLTIEDKILTITTNTMVGEVVDEVELGVSCGKTTVVTSARMLQRALPYADTMLISNHCIAVGGPSNFCHLLAVKESKT